jgi:hypothetical protein
MGMREECKHFQSRTYKTGDVARFCSLGNAPDQPFSCPADCVTFEPRLADVGWSHGSLINRPNVPTPDGSADERQDVLAQAEEIVGAVAPELFAERREELERESRKKNRGWKFWQR